MDDRSPAPGSQLWASMWVREGVLFYSSGRVWDVAAFARKHGTAVQKICFAFVLCRRKPANRPAVCGKWGQAGHRDADDSCHALAAQLDWLTLLKDETLSRFPTDQERDRMKAQYGTARAPLPGRGRGRGDDSRGRGRGQGAQGGARGHKWRRPDFRHPSGKANPAGKAGRR